MANVANAGQLTAPTADVERDRALPKRPRISLDFTQDAYLRVKELMVMARLSTLQDVFRDALRVYEWYQVRRAEGYKILLQKDGETTVVDLGL